MKIVNGFVKEEPSGDWININRVSRFSVEKLLNGNYKIYGNDMENWIWIFSEEYDVKAKADYVLLEALRKAEPYYGRE